MGKFLFVLFGLLVVVALVLAANSTGVLFVMPVVHVPTVTVPPEVQGIVTFMTTSH
jgi:hypothetical protein